MGEFGGGAGAKMTNPAGFANVRAHAEAHLKVLQAQEMVAAAKQVAPNA